MMFNNYKNRSHFSKNLKKNGKLYIWFLSFISYFNLVRNFSIVSIWSLIFQCYVNLVFIIISWMEIANVTNSQN